MVSKQTTLRKVTTTRAGEVNITTITAETYPENQVLIERHVWNDTTAAINLQSIMLKKSEVKALAEFMGVL